MALTNDRAEAQKKIETYQALIDIAKSIKELAAQPNFAELSKQAYALPENDQRKAEEGRAIIIELDAKIADQRSRAIDLQAEQDNIDLRKKELETAANKITENRKQVEAREDVVSKREKAADERDKKQNERDVVLSERESKLREREVGLGNDIAKFEAEKDESRRRAEEIRKLSEGL